MKTNPQPSRALFGLLCLAASAAGASAGGELSTAGARVWLSAKDEQAAEAIEEADRSWLAGWAGSIEFGLTGASGNNENFNLRGAASASREDDRTADQINLVYTYANDEGDKTENRFQADGRHGWKFSESPWRVYVGATYEYDEFQDWDHRLSVGPGVGYQAVETDKTSLLLRAGINATREFGGSDDRWHPEADLGLDLNHQLTERQSLEAVFDLYPSLDPTGPYRFVGKAGWRIDVDPEVNLFLRLGVEDRYDSSPGPDKKRNDISYYATLGWSF